MRYRAVGPIRNSASKRQADVVRASKKLYGIKYSIVRKYCFDASRNAAGALRWIRPAAAIPYRLQVLRILAGFARRTWEKREQRDAKLLFADSFKHECLLQEQNSDDVKFSVPVIIRKWRIIRKGGATHKLLELGIGEGDRGGARGGTSGSLRGQRQPRAVAVGGPAFKLRRRRGASCRDCRRPIRAKSMRSPMRSPAAIRGCSKSCSTPSTTG